MSSERISLATYWQLVRDNANFRRLWLAQIVSEMGDWFYTIALYTLLLELTGQANSVALALMLQVLPQTLIGPAAGVINDRLRRKHVMIAADLARVVIVLLMLLVRSRETVWLVYPLLALETIMWAFFEPARSAVIPNLVRREQAILANTLSSTTWSFNLAMGAALGGVVAAVLGRDTVFVLNALSFAVSAVLLARMQFAEPHSEGHAPFRARDLVNFSPVAEGIRYVRRDLRLLVTLFAKTGLGVVGASWVLFPVMAQRLFPLQVSGYGGARAAMLSLSLLVGARGVGAIIGPLLAAPWAQSSERRLRLGILGGYVLMALGYLLLSAATSLLLACASVIVAHVGGSVVWVLSTTLLQLGTEDRFRGRVFSAELGFCMLALGLGAYVAGNAIDRGSALSSVAFGIGLAGLAAGLLWACALGAWRRASQPWPVAAD